MSKRDFILVGTIVFVAAAIYIVNRVFIQKPADTVQVTVDGKQYMTLPLSEATQITIEGVNGGTNLLTIKDGYAQVVEASCPDKLCVHQKNIHNNGEKIICLPNKVLVEVISGNQSSIDAVAN